MSYRTEDERDCDDLEMYVACLEKEKEALAAERDELKTKVDHLTRSNLILEVKLDLAEKQIDRWSKERAHSEFNN